MLELTDLSDEKFFEIWNAAIDWQFLTGKSGKMAKKSDLDNYLMENFDLTLDAAHTVSNFIEDKFYFRSGKWYEWNAGRPEPTKIFKKNSI